MDEERVVNWNLSAEFKAIEPKLRELHDECRKAGLPILIIVQVSSTEEDDGITTEISSTCYADGHAKHVDTDLMRILSELEEPNGFQNIGRAVAMMKAAEKLRGMAGLFGMLD